MWSWWCHRVMVWLTLALGVMYVGNMYLSTIFQQAIFCHTMNCTGLYCRGHGFKSHSSLNFFLNFFQVYWVMCITAMINDHLSVWLSYSSNRLFSIFAATMKPLTPHWMSMFQTGLELKQVLEYLKQFGSWFWRWFSKLLSQCSLLG